MILETDRFILREFDADKDAQAMHDLNSDPDVIKYTGDHGFENFQHAHDLLKNYPDYSKYGMGRWIMERKSDHKTVGWCGLKFHPETKLVDLGYRFYKAEWGKGYATEGAKACLKYGFEVLGLELVYAEAAKENTASIRVIEKLGMTFWENGTCGEYPSDKYKITKEAWLSQ